MKTNKKNVQKCFILIFIFLLSIFSCLEVSNEIKSLNDIGVPLKMAEYRYTQVKDVNYKLSISIPEDKKLPIESVLILSLTIKDVSHPLYLDFKESTSALKDLRVNDKAIAIVHEKEHIIIPKEELKLGVNSIKINFIAGELSLNRNDNYLYTLLVPDRARTFFPCFDQPNIKATYDLKITAPKDWEVLCGAPIKSKDLNVETITYNFEKTDLMSTYLFSIVVGKFNVISSEETNRSMKMLYRETNEEKIEASTSKIFKLHQFSLDFIEDYTQYKFPFKKIDFAAIPGFQYGGMEHTGAIQYRESKLFLDNSATTSQELSRAKLIAHETAHMWFGNLVTMQWFNDVWLKEVFANFMADKIVNPVFPDVNHDLQFLTSHYPSAYGVDRTAGANSIRQDLDNLKNAGSLYGSIIYNKAPIMMRQLELVLGKDKFKEGIREYITTYANGNVDWSELVNIFDKQTDMDLKSWSDVWVNSTGRPIFSENIIYDDSNKIKQFTLSQKSEDGDSKYWPQSFNIDLVYKDSIVTISVVSDSESIEIPKVIGLAKPKYILYNSNAYGYGVFPVSEEVILHSSLIKDEVSRAHVYININENLLNGKLVDKIVFENLKKALITETNESILQLLSGQITNLYWDIFTQKQRTIYQPDLENIIYNTFHKKVAKNFKKILYKTYKLIANSKTGIDHLYKIWNKEEIIDNLILNQDDYTSLAQQLALFGHPKAKEILAKAKLELTNPDQIQKFNFLAPAINANPEVRTAFFKSFRDQKNREKENWIQTACWYIHHPLQQEEAIKTLGLSLELLEEIQETGDIFFPLGWLTNTIGRYNSKEAFTIVEAYLYSHPDLDKNLKRKLLQSTDKLYKKYKQ